MAHPLPGQPGTNTWGDGVDAALAAFPAANLTGTVDDARLPVTAQAATLRATYVSYVLPPLNEQWQDTANVLAAVNALPTGALGGGRIIFQPGQYQLRDQLPNVNNVTYEGAGNSATVLLLVNGSLLAPTTILHDIAFRSLKLLSTSASHLFDFIGSGGLALSHFTDCWFQTTVAGAGLFYMSSAGDFGGNTFTRCQFLRPASSTTSGINLINTNGGLNDNTWTDCRFSSSLATSGGPFVRLESPNDYCHDNAFRGITGEQNPAGLIHVFSPDGLILDNVAEWDDGATALSNHSCLVGVTTGLTPRNVFTKNVNIRYATNMGAWLPLYPPDPLDWVSYTPTLTGTGSSLGNGTVTGAFQQIGKTVNFWAQIVLGSTTVMGSLVEISLPSAKAGTANFTSMSGLGTHTGVAVFDLRAGTGMSQDLAVMYTSAMAYVTATVPFTWAATDIIELRGTYQAA